MYTHNQHLAFEMIALKPSIKKLQREIVSTQKKVFKTVVLKNTQSKKVSIPMPFPVNAQT